MANVHIKAGHIFRESAQCNDPKAQPSDCFKHSVSRGIFYSWLSLISAGEDVPNIVIFGCEHRSAINLLKLSVDERQIIKGKLD